MLVSISVTFAVSVSFSFVCALFISFLSFLPRSFAEAVGCEMASLKACAKKKSFQDLSSAQLSVFDDLNFLRFAPVVDGYFMPGVCYAIIKIVPCRNNQYGNLIRFQLCSSILGFHLQPMVHQRNRGIQSGQGFVASFAVRPFK